MMARGGRALVFSGLKKSVSSKLCGRIGHDFRGSFWEYNGGNSVVFRCKRCGKSVEVPKAEVEFDVEEFSGLGL